MKGKYMQTGEVGFCPQCGTLAEVVVLPEDRLQARIFRAGAVLRLRSSTDAQSSAQDALVAWVVGLFEAAGWAVDDLQGAAPVEVAHLALEAARVASQAEMHRLYSEGARMVWDREALEELKETLVELQIRLVMCAEAIGEVVDGQFDLMREAAETVEGGNLSKLKRSNVQRLEEDGG